MKRPDTETMRERIDYFDSFLAGKRVEMPPTGDDVIPDYIEDVEALLAYVEHLEDQVEQWATSPLTRDDQNAIAHENRNEGHPHHDRCGDA